MESRIQLLIGDDGKASIYDDTYDIIIHCESEEEQAAVIAKLKSMDWIPCSERLPDKMLSTYLVTDNEGDVYICGWASGEWVGAPREIIAWMLLPEPYKGGEEHE